MDSSVKASSIFNTFNARNLDPGQVARTFVPPEFFHETIKGINTLIVGPRGSGKTTILKMLQPASLEAWTRPEAETYRSQIDFTGVFIPTDRSWQGQLEALERVNTLLPQNQEISIATFTTHVFRALADAMHYRIHAHEIADSSCIPFRRVTIRREEEVELVEQISDIWRLDVAVPTFRALRHSLTRRLSSIWEFGHTLRQHTTKTPRSAPEIPAYFSLNYFHHSVPVIELFNDIVGEREGKWAFLFDELELAPETLREELMKSLRGVDNRILFKLSISPYGEKVDFAKEPGAATLGNDYNQVALWYAHKEDGYKFCEALFKSLLENQGLSPCDPVELLGIPSFEMLPRNASGAGKRGPYAPDSALYRSFVRLGETDKTFNKYLAEKGIDLDNLTSLNENERAATIRKVRTIVALRDTYLNDSGTTGNTGSRRSRKSLSFYSGASSLFSIVEGNPRWFIGIVGALIEDYKKRGKLFKRGKIAKIPPRSQADEVTKAVHRFRAFLKTIPCPPVVTMRQPRGVITVLDTIGKYFEQSVLGDDFTADPYLTFTVDSHTDPELIDSLGRALNAGAIVYVHRKGDELLLTSLKGKRFRLSYILAPFHKLPLMLGKSRSLSKILAEAAKENLFEDVEPLFSDIDDE